MIPKKEYAATAMGLQEMLDDFGGKNAMADMTKDRDTNNYVKKQVIYSEGNHPSRLYYILEGKVKTFKMNDNGKELTVGLYNQGDFLGYTALLEGTPYRDTAEAMEATELAIIPRDEFDKLVHNNREVTRKFIQLLAKNVAEKEEQLLKLAYNSLRKRVADALLTLQHKYKKEDEEKFYVLWAILKQKN
jgi:CRP-like cAMP-binding protein